VKQPTDLVLVDHPRPHVARVTMNRPERLNAMSIDLVLELDRALTAAGEDNDTWVIVLTGAGRAFSSGLDLKDYGVIPNVDGLTVGRIAQRSMRAYSKVVLTMRRLHQPIVAAVNGPAFGGGMCLALAAEVRIASESAVLNATGIVNGLTSTEMASAWLLPRLIGAAHANDLLLTGRRIDAAEAMRMGLVSRVVADEEIGDVALDIATQMCRFSPYGLSMTKNALWASHEIASLETAIEFEDRNQLLLGFTENLQEAIRAFDAGREPVYTDEPRRDIFNPRS
jgi:enoyl-CoA hydratase